MCLCFGMSRRTASLAQLRMQELRCGALMLEQKGGGAADMCFRKGPLQDSTDGRHFRHPRKDTAQRGNTTSAAKSRAWRSALQCILQIRQLFSMGSQVAL